MPEVKKLYSTTTRYTQLLDFAISLEGLSRHTGVHAAGVVIAPGPLDDYVPDLHAVDRKGAGAGERRDASIVTQYDMNCLEKAGMLKMDFLGLTTLTVIRDALDNIKARTGKPSGPGRASTSTTRRPTACCARAARPACSSSSRRSRRTCCARMRCDRFDDLVASNALLRPGPLDAGMHKVYISAASAATSRWRTRCPELEPILEPTYGVITYQEQVMRIAQVLAGISLAEADVLRKAVGKKDAELIKKELGKFVDEGGRARLRPQDHRGARGPDRDVRPLRLQQVALGRLLGGLVPHRVAQGALSRPSSWRRSCRRSIGDTDRW